MMASPLPFAPDVEKRCAELRRLRRLRARLQAGGAGRAASRTPAGVAVVARGRQRR
jgi:hypothetical protein